MYCSRDERERNGLPDADERMSHRYRGKCSTKRLSERHYVLCTYYVIATFSSLADMILIIPQGRNICLSVFLDVLWEVLITITT